MIQALDEDMIEKCVDERGLFGVVEHRPLYLHTADDLHRDCGRGDLPFTDKGRAWRRRRIWTLKLW